MRCGRESLHLPHSIYKDKQMKKGFSILLIMCAALLAVSCGKGRSYTDMLKAENKAIDRLITKNGFEILKEFPADTVFKENQFVKLENGVYLNIIDRGTAQRAVSGETNILYRCIVSYPMDSAYVYQNSVYLINAYKTKDGRSVNYGPNSNGTDPYEMLYQDPDLYYSISGNFASEGLMTPLKYVGDGAKVKLIVPFKRGISNDNNNGEPAYYEILQYTFEENL